MLTTAAPPCLMRTAKFLADVTWMFRTTELRGRIRIRGIVVVVVEIVSVRRESGALAEETGLRWHDGDFAARADLFDAQTAVAFAAPVSHQFSIGRNGGKPDGLSMLGERADVYVSSVNRGTASAQEFVKAECRGCH